MDIKKNALLKRTHNMFSSLKRYCEKAWILPLKTLYVNKEF